MVVEEMDVLANNETSMPITDDIVGTTDGLGNERKYGWDERKDHQKVN
jgi:hypothetical protein